MVSSTNCEKWIDHLLEKYHSSRVSNMTVCNIWPTDESKTIVFLPLPSGSEDSILYDLDVLLVDTQSSKLIAHHWEPDTFGSIMACIHKMAVKPLFVMLKRNFLSATFYDQYFFTLTQIFVRQIT